MKSHKLRLRNAPFFPVIPLVPLALAGGLLALEVAVLKRLRRLGRSVDTLLYTQQHSARPEPA